MAAEISLYLLGLILYLVKSGAEVSVCWGRGGRERGREEKREGEGEREVLTFLRALRI